MFVVLGKHTYFFYNVCSVMAVFSFSQVAIMRTRIRCHSAGSRALRSSEIGETGRACNIQSTVKPIYKDVVVIGIYLVSI